MAPTKNLENINFEEEDDGCFPLLEVPSKLFRARFDLSDCLCLALVSPAACCWGIEALAERSYIPRWFHAGNQLEWLQANRPGLITALKSDKLAFEVPLSTEFRCRGPSRAYVSPAPSGSAPSPSGPIKITGSLPFDPPFRIQALHLCLNDLKPSDCADVVRAVLAAAPRELRLDIVPFIPESPCSPGGTPLSARSWNAPEQVLPLNGLAAATSLESLCLSYSNGEGVGIRLGLPKSLVHLDLKVPSINIAEPTEFGAQLAELSLLKKLALRDHCPYLWSELPSWIPTHLESLDLVMRTENQEFSRRAHWQQFIDSLAFALPDLKALRIRSDHLDHAAINFTRLSALARLVLELRIVGPMVLPATLVDLEVSVTGALVAPLTSPDSFTHRTVGGSSSGSLTHSPYGAGAGHSFGSAGSGGGGSGSARDMGGMASWAKRCIFPSGLPSGLHTLRFHNMAPTCGMSGAGGEAPDSPARHMCSCSSQAFAKLLVPMASLRRFEYVGCVRSSRSSHVWHKVAGSLPHLQVLEVFEADPEPTPGAGAPEPAPFPILPDGASPADGLKPPPLRSALLYSFYRHSRGIPRESISASSSYSNGIQHLAGPYAAAMGGQRLLPSGSIPQDLSGFVYGSHGGRPHFGSLGPSSFSDASMNSLTLALLAEEEEEARDARAVLDRRDALVEIEEAEAEAQAEQRRAARTARMSAPEASLRTLGLETAGSVDSAGLGGFLEQEASEAPSGDDSMRGGRAMAGPHPQYQLHDHSAHNGHGYQTAAAKAWLRSSSFKLRAGLQTGIDLLSRKVGSGLFRDHPATSDMSDSGA